MHFCNLLLDLLVEEFHSYLADFPLLREAEAASCDSQVTEYEDRDALKQVGLNKSPGLHGLLYEVDLRLSLFWGIYSTLGFHRVHLWTYQQGCDHIAEERW